MSKRQYHTTYGHVKFEYVFPYIPPTFLPQSSYIPDSAFLLHCSSCSVPRWFLRYSSYTVPTPFRLRCSSSIVPPALFLLHCSSYIPAFLAYMPPTSLTLHSSYTVPPTLLLHSWLCTPPTLFPLDSWLCIPPIPFLLLTLHSSYTVSPPTFLTNPAVHRRCLNIFAILHDTCIRQMQARKHFFANQWLSIESDV